MLPDDSSLPQPTTLTGRLLRTLGRPIWGAAILLAACLIASLWFPPQKATVDGVTTVTDRWELELIWLLLCVASLSGFLFMVRQPYDVVVITGRQGGRHLSRASGGYLALFLFAAINSGEAHWSRVSIDGEKLLIRSLIWGMNLVKFNELRGVSFECRVTRHRNHDSYDDDLIFHLQSGYSQRIEIESLLSRALPELIAQLERRKIAVADQTTDGRFHRLLEEAKLADLPKEQQAAIREANRRNASPPVLTEAERQAAMQQYQSKLREERLQALPGSRWKSQIDLPEVTLEFSTSETVVIEITMRSQFTRSADETVKLQATSSRIGNRFRWQFDDGTTLEVTPFWPAGGVLQISAADAVRRGKAAIAANVLRSLFRPLE